MVFDGRLRLFSEVVALDVGRVRRCMLRSEFTQERMDMDPIVLDACTSAHAHPDDEDPPALPHGALAICPPSDSSASFQASEDGPSRLHRTSGVRFDN